jgi:hypothetical protein
MDGIDVKSTIPPNRNLKSQSAHTAQTGTNRVRIGATDMTNYGSDR